MPYQDPSKKDQLKKERKCSQWVSKYIPYRADPLSEENTASHTTVLHLKRLNQTESPIFVIVCVLCFQRQSFLTFILVFGGEMFSKFE